MATILAFRLEKGASGLKKADNTHQYKESQEAADYSIGGRLYRPKAGCRGDEEQD